MTPTDPLDLTDRVAVVTGGTRGIGLASARHLARAGANVIVIGRVDAQQAHATAARLAEEFQVHTLGLVADAGDPVAIKAAYQQVRSEFGRINVLVNNAGVLQDALVGMISESVITETLDINAAGPIRHLQSAARMMRKNGGSIINMTSIIGRRGNVGQVVYGASKAAVIGMTLSAAKELASRGIRVNAIAPGFIDTDMTRALPSDTFDARVDSVAMGRVGTPEDVANAVLFLASDLSAYITGQVIGVDGGMLI